MGVKNCKEEKLKTQQKSERKKERKKLMGGLKEWVTLFRCKLMAARHY